LFYKEFIDCLRADSAVTDTVTDFPCGETTVPAIFRAPVPEDAVMPYISVNIDGNSTPSGLIEEAIISVDYWDYSNSRAVSDTAAKAVKNLLHFTVMKTDDYSEIRIKRGSFGYVNQNDLRDIHYNTQFSARATDSGWMKETLQ
jgi:hypothetical protein